MLIYRLNRKSINLIKTRLTINRKLIVYNKIKKWM